MKNFYKGDFVVFCPKNSLCIGVDNFYVKIIFLKIKYFFVTICSIR